MRKVFLKKSVIVVVAMALSFICWSNKISVNAQEKAEIKQTGETSEDPYANVNKIALKDFFLQEEDDYYVYFYMIRCPYCNEIRNQVLDFASRENNSVYFVDYALGENRPLQKYSWNETRNKYNRKIGYVDGEGNKIYLPGESEEKYLNMLNDFGKKMAFNFVTVTNENLISFPCAALGDIYTDIQTPEINYASMTGYEELLIAGVPTLLHVQNGKITGFYFDSFEIGNFLGAIK